MTYNTTGRRIRTENLADPATVTLSYDAMGRQTRAVDAAGVTTLAYPNGLTASWAYGSRGELLEIDNALPSGSVSKYAYTYDAAGRRITCARSGTAFTTPDTYAYLYNARSELTNATAMVDTAYSYGYQFDDIGNRETASERGTNSVYEANNLNQYTSVNDFVPQFDADGNQTLVKTSTGIWSVTYNGENRPVLWSQGTNTIAMNYDRMGRRVTKNDQRFVYNGYLQVADNTGNAYIWDCTEPIATRPLVWRHDGETFFYVHDGNKNVSEVIFSAGDTAAHYEYAPFGALTVSRGSSAAANPWRYSSEWFEDDVVTGYYNYRHYGLICGRWFCRDFLDTYGGLNLVAYSLNDPINHGDILGLRGNDPPNLIDTGVAAPPIVDKCDVLEASATFTEFNQYFEVWSRMNFRVDVVSPDRTASGYGSSNFQLSPYGPPGILVASHYAWLSYKNGSNRGLQNKLKARKKYKCEIRFKACCKRELDKTTYTYSGEQISSTFIDGFTAKATDKEHSLGIFSHTPDENRYEDASFVPSCFEYDRRKRACEAKAAALKSVENIRFEYTDSEIYNLFK